MARVTVLMYHMVSDPVTAADRPFCCPEQMFRSHLKYLRGADYELVSLDRVLAHLDGNAIKKDSVAITFDDGFRDNYDNAFPLLQEFAVPATIFLVTSTIGGTNRWMENRGFSTRPMMGWQHAAEMAKSGIVLGGHTLTHPRLTGLADADVKSEVGDCARIIADRTGFPTDQFAYPFGDFDGRVRDIVAASGYRLACSTRSGFNAPMTDAFSIRRIEVAGTDTVAMLKRKMKFGTNDGSVKHVLSYYAKRLKSRLLRRGTQRSK